MTWDAIAALSVVALAVYALVRQFRREDKVCDKCETVEQHRKRAGAGVTKKPVSSLRLARK